MSERSKQPKQGDSDASVASPPVGGATSLYRPRELIVERGAAYAIIVCFFYMLMKQHEASRQIIRDDYTTDREINSDCKLVYERWILSAAGR